MTKPQTAALATIKNPNYTVVYNEDTGGAVIFKCGSKVGRVDRRVLKGLFDANLVAYAVFTNYIVAR